MKLSKPLVVSWLLAAASLLATGETIAASTTQLDKMPPELETRLALSAAPPQLRAGATVYLLDPAKGYYVGREGTNRFSCLVTRTYWFKLDLRDDIYDPGCFAAKDLKSGLRVWLDTAALRASGRSAGEIKQEIAKRFASGVYPAPTRFSLSYMLAPLMRTYTNAVDDADSNVMTMTYPHVMYFAAHVTDADLGPNPQGSVYPQVIPIGQFTYVMQRLGNAETAQVVDEQRELLDGLCKYRDVLCLKDHDHAAVH